MFLGQKNLLIEALSIGNLGKFKELLDNGANIHARDEKNNTPLHIAARHGHLNIIKELLSRGAEIDAKNNYSSTPLHLAARYGHLNVVKKLLDKGAKVNKKNRKSSTPLHLAARYGHLNVVKKLLDKGAEIYDKDNDGFTPIELANNEDKSEIVNFFVSYKGKRGYTLLHYAALANDSDLMGFLLKKGAKIYNKNNDGYTPLHLAALKGNLNIVKKLLDNGAAIYNKNNDGFTPIELANNEDKLEVVNFLVSYRDKRDYTLLHYAARHDNTNLVGLLLEKSADINAKDNDGSTPLHLAVRYGKLNVVEKLLDNGAEVDAKNNSGSTPLHLAARYGKLNVVEKLLDNGAAIYNKNNNGFTLIELANNKNNLEVVNFLVSYRDKRGYTLLHYAATYNDSNLIGFLLEKGAEIDAKDNDGSTPLHLAARYGKLNVVEKLLDNGAEVDAKNNSGSTPLHLAARYGKLNVVEKLLDNGAAIYNKNNNGFTLIELANNKNNLEVVNFLVSYRDKHGYMLLHYAARDDNTNLVGLLLEKSADINAKDNDGSTPLHLAARYGKLSVVKELLDKSADINTKNNDGLTPLDIAKDRKHSNIIKYFEEKLSKEREPVQRKRRHYYEDRNHHGHLSCKSLAIDSSNQFEIAISRAARTSSWINDLFGWVKSSIGGFRSALPIETSNITTKLQVDAPMDINGTIILLDVLIRKVTGQKYISTVDHSVSLLKAQGYALNIIEEFEKVVCQAAENSKISMHRLNIDFVEIQKGVKGKIMSGNFNEISVTLNSYVEKTLPSRKTGDSGRLSTKKFDKFMNEFNKGLLNQSIEHNRDGKLGVSGAKKQQMSLEPQSYLSNASIQSHSKDKVSTCLSDIGVTKLGGNLNR